MTNKSSAITVIILLLIIIALLVTRLGEVQNRLDQITPSTSTTSIGDIK